MLPAVLLNLTSFGLAVLGLIVLLIAVTLLHYQLSRLTRSSTPTFHQR